MGGAGMRRGLALCVILLALSGCTGAVPGGRQPPGAGAGGTAPPSVAEPTPTPAPTPTVPDPPDAAPPVSAPPPSPAPAVPTPAAPASPSPGRADVDLFIGGTWHHGTVTLTAEGVVAALDSGHKQVLKTKLGGKPLPDMAAVAIPSLAVPRGADHLLVTLTNGRNVEAWVLVPGEDGFTIAADAWVDWGVQPVGNLLKVSNRRYKQEGGMFVVSDLWRYNPETRRYEDAPALPVPLQAYTVEGLAMLPVGAQSNLPAWIMRTDGDHSLGKVGVFVVTDSRTVTLLSTLSQQGRTVLDTVTGVDARDIDGDGTLEYLVQGLSGAHFRALQVYQWDAAASAFRFRAEVGGDKGLIVAGAPGQTVVETNNRDYKSTDVNALLTHRYTWVKDHFVETH